MAFLCPGCGLEYDAALFQFGIAFRCDCGELVRGEHQVSTGEDWAYRKIQRQAERIAFLIVASDYPDIDIDLEISGLRRFCRRHFPDRLGLFDRVYGARFRRLREQFRS